MTILTKRQNEYYPLLSVAVHEMEGNFITEVSYPKGNEFPTITLLNGETCSWYQYEQDRKRWEQEGFPASDGLLHDFPRKLQYYETWNLPLLDIEDATYSTFLWGNAERRLQRSKQPLVINWLNGDSMELYDWATEPDLVQLLKTRYPEDECFQGYFRLIMEIPLLDSEEDTEFRDISKLNADNWYTILEGTMPLTVTFEYLDEQESEERTRQHNRSLMPLSIGTALEEGRYTLENWAVKPFYSEDLIHLGNELRKKYPELRDHNFEMLIELPGLEEPENISTMTQLTQQRILEADIPLEVRLVIYEQ